MPRFSKRRYKRKPKARKRIDKVQNKRIKRLEESIEKKFQFSATAETLVSAHLTTTQSQIYAVLPNLSYSNPNPRGQGFIGNQVSLRSCKTDFMLTNTLLTGAEVRVIFFWSIAPRTWATDTVSGPPLSVHAPPTWHQLLANFEPETGFTNGRVNMVSPRQLLSRSNKSPILILSDKVYHLGGKESSNSAKKLVFAKAYKSMKLTYNIEASTGVSNAPVNRQLYMAVIPCHTDEDETSSVGSVRLSYSTQMHYTDA